MAGETCTVALYGNKGDVTISAEDYDRVQKRTWYLNQNYAKDSNGQLLHIFIMGERPADIPADYIIDHADRNKLNNARSNLRWVDHSFNQWNVAIIRDFKGVSFDKGCSKWAAQFCLTKLGRYEDKKDAARAVAKAAVEKWPLWAPTSDLLVGPGLFSKEEMVEICAELPFVKAIKSKELPKGVQLHGKRYRIQYRSKYLAWYDTAEEALKALKKYVQDKEEQEERDHLNKPILRDEHGHAVIPLSGKKGKGLFTRVPDELWHTLMKGSWYLSGEYAQGWWAGGTQTLHTVVFTLLNPNYDRSLSIDHRVPENKLDNRSENLRAATPLLQSHNRGKKSGTSSQYIGVSKAPNGLWRAEIMYQRTKHYLGMNFKTEHDAARSRNAKAKELLGDDATIQVVLDEP